MCGNMGVKAVWREGGAGVGCMSCCAPGLARAGVQKAAASASGAGDSRDGKGMLEMGLAWFGGMG